MPVKDYHACCAKADCKGRKKGIEEYHRCCKANFCTKAKAKDKKAVGIQKIVRATSTRAKKVILRKKLAPSLKKVPAQALKTKILRKQKKIVKLKMQKPLKVIKQIGPPLNFNVAKNPVSSATKIASLARMKAGKKKAINKEADKFIEGGKKVALKTITKLIKKK